MIKDPRQSIFILATRFVYNYTYYQAISVTIFSQEDSFIRLY